LTPARSIEVGGITEETVERSMLPSISASLAAILYRWQEEVTHRGGWE